MKDKAILICNGRTIACVIIDEVTAGSIEEFRDKLRDTERRLCESVYIESVQDVKSMLEKLRDATERITKTIKELHKIGARQGNTPRFRPYLSDHYEGRRYDSIKWIDRIRSHLIGSGRYLSVFFLRFILFVTVELFELLLVLVGLMEAIGGAVFAVLSSICPI